jgi:transcriptional regulator with XRE-family HTH domain
MVREKKGMSLREVGNAIGRTESRMWQVEQKATSQMHRSALAKLAGALGFESLEEFEKQWQSTPVAVPASPTPVPVDRPAVKKLVRAVEKSGDREAAWDLVYEAIYAVGRMEGATVGEVVGALKEGLREARRGPQLPDDGTAPPRSHPRAERNYAPAQCQL